MSDAGKMIIDHEIEILLKKGVIVPSDFVSGDLFLLLSQDLKQICHTELQKN